MDRNGHSIIKKALLLAALISTTAWGQSVFGPIKTPSVRTDSISSYDNTSFVNFPFGLKSKDSVFTLQDNSDTSKQLQFQLSGISTATTRTLTVPNASDVIVGRDTTDTLTNKTMGSTNTLTGATAANFTNSGTISLPTSTDTLVGRATTDTLTNKTLSGNTATNLISGSGTLTLNTTGTVTVPNATDTLVGKATADVLTNKDFDGDTASNTHRITVPKDTTTNINALTRKEATIIYDTTTGQLKFDNGATLSALSTTAAASPTSAGTVTSYFPVIQSAVSTVTNANATSTTTDGFLAYLFSTGNTPRTLTLPASSANTGRTILVKKTDSGTGTITVTRAGSDTIDGATTLVLTSQYDSVTIAADGTNWSRIDSPLATTAIAGHMSTGTQSLAGAKTWTGNQSVAAQLDVSSATLPPTKSTRTSAATNTFLTSLQLFHSTSGAMADGFGANIDFQALDTAATPRDLGGIGFIRDGNDTSGAFQVVPFNTGAGALALKVRPSGANEIGPTAGAVSHLVNGSLSLNTTETTQAVNGFRRSATNTVALSTNSVDRLTVNTASATSTLPFLGTAAGTATASAPSYSFTGDTNTGVFSSAADTLDLTTGGTSRFTLSTTTMTTTLPHLGQDGSVGNPSYSFSGDPDTGFYRIGSGDVGISTNNSLTFENSAGAITGGVEGASVSHKFNGDTFIMEGSTNNHRVSFNNTEPGNNLTFPATSLAGGTGINNKGANLLFTDPTVGSGTDYNAALVGSYYDNTNAVLGIVYRDMFTVTAQRGALTVMATKSTGDTQIGHTTLTSSSNAISTPVTIGDAYNQTSGTLTPVNSPSLFSRQALASQTCTTTCGTSPTNTTGGGCVAAWTSGNAFSTCGSVGANQQCLCAALRTAF